MGEQEIAKDIILKMIETGKLALKEKSNINREEQEINSFNINEICKAYKSIYQAVQKP